MNLPPVHTPLTDAQLDAALSAGHDQILPSSGFSDAVMTAVRAEAAAPAPIPFPWKRAIPGMVGIAAGLTLLVALVATLISAVVHSRPASAGKLAVGSQWVVDFTPLLRHAAGSDAAWMALSIAIPLVCLLALRRVLFSR
ncbi:MAG TPA: hypothetical protein VME68_17190 [Acidobacteriaceae bacterium]|nr:hypothetical protein [Acidobacteriaceae bacterium]